MNPVWENPCAGQGHGVLVDLRSDRDGAAWTLVAQAADNLAVAGLGAPTLDQAQQAARGVAAVMTLISEARYDECQAPLARRTRRTTSQAMPASTSTGTRALRAMTRASAARRS